MKKNQLTLIERYQTDSEAQSRAAFRRLMAQYLAQDGVPPAPSPLPQGE